MVSQGKNYRDKNQMTSLQDRLNHQKDRDPKMMIKENRGTKIYNKNNQKLLKKNRLKKWK